MFNVLNQSKVSIPISAANWFTTSWSEQSKNTYLSKRKTLAVNYDLTSFHQGE